MPRAKATTEPPVWAEVQWPSCSPTGHANMLCVDQSLVNSGWVWMLVRNAARPMIQTSGTIHTEPTGTFKGFADSFARGDILFEQYQKLIDALKPMVVLYEMPAITGRVVTRNREAATVAAMSLRNAAAVCKVPIDMVQSQHAKKTLTGNGNATKDHVREQVKQVFPAQRWNEHTSDAAAIGITAILDGMLARILGSVDDA